MIFQIGCKDFLEDLLKKGPINKESFFEATKEFKKDTIRVTTRRMGVVITKHDVSLPDNYWNKKHEREEAAKKARQKPKKTSRSINKFYLPDIQTTVCIFIQKTDGDMELMINKEYADDLLYCDPKKYKDIFSKVSLSVQNEIKKAEEIICFNGDRE